MKINLLIIALLLPLLTTAQNSRFHIDILAHESILNGEQADTYTPTVNSLLEMRIKRYQNQDLQFYYQFNDHIALGTGLSLTTIYVDQIFNCPFCIPFGIQRHPSLVRFVAMNAHAQRNFSSAGSHLSHRSKINLLPHQIVIPYRSKENLCALWPKKLCINRI